jgi:DNA-directed RNA polymerase subunit RPC12/RpoP
MNILFILVAIILASLVFYFTVKHKIKCANCKSSDVSATGQKKYNEDNVAIQGSPSSYQDFEYKCNKCGAVFWASKEAAIFN